MNLSNVFDISNTLVYISGVRMPATSISVTSAFNAFPSCTVTLPPDSKLFGIGRRDRVPLHIFVENVFCQKYDSYIMLFEGEIVSFGYTSTDSGREMVVNGRSNMCFLQDVDIRVLVGIDDFAAAVVPGADTANMNVAGGVSYPMSLVMSGVSACTPNNIIKYPYGFIENVALFLANNIQEPVPETKVFQFYRDYAASLKFTNRFSRLPYFDDANAPWGPTGFPVLAGVQRLAALQQLNGILSNGPDIRSLYSVLDYVATKMEYEISSFASPTYDGTNLISLSLKPIFYEAIPPRCNIIFRSHNQSLRTQEPVYQVPTRVRIKDQSGVLNLLSHGQSSALVQFGISDYYPKESATDSENPVFDPFANELLDSEQFTGPYAYEALPPDWMSYVDPVAVKSESEDSYKRNIMRHMLTLKIYEGRTLHCSTVFNPFYTSGFPGAVFDTDDAGFTFIGQVMTVTHTISKRSAGTSVSMSFVRTLKEEMENPLRNSLAIVDTVSKDNPTAMSQVYMSQIGCAAIPFSDMEALFSMAYNSDPSATYKFNQRSIVTLPEYIAFLGNGNAVGEEVTLPNGSQVPAQLTGPAFSPRYDSSLVTTLQEIARTAFDGVVYA